MVTDPAGAGDGHDTNTHHARPGQLVTRTRARSLEAVTTSTTWRTGDSLAGFSPAGRHQLHQIQQLDPLPTVGQLQQLDALGRSLGMVTIAGAGRGGQVTNRPLH